MDAFAEKNQDVIVTVPLDDTDFDSYTDLDLVRLHDELVKRNNILEAENNLFESYLSRVDPHILKGDERGDEATKTEDERGKDVGRTERKKKKGEKTKEADKPILLTPEQKSEIATRELEELRDEIEKQKEDWGKILDNYKVNFKVIYFKTILKLTNLL
jgi:hypothetical protein